MTLGDFHNRFALALLALATYAWFTATAEAESTDFKIVVLPGGTEIEYSGRIAFGASSALRSALNDNPGVKVLHLNSFGGSVYWARQMQDLVHDRGLTTVIDTHCMSACALVFLSGQERYLAPGAKLGFHRESAPGESPAEINAVEETDAQHMKAAGISSSFVEKVFSTPSSDIWIPTMEELKAAHVITDVAGKFTTPDDVKLPPNLAEQLLGENPFKLLQAREPDRFKALRDRMIAALGGRAPQSDIDPLPTNDITPLMYTYLAHTSDALAVEFAQGLQAYFAKLDAKNPDECYFILFPRRAPGKFDASDVLTEDEFAAFADLQARLVSDGASRNAPIPSEPDIIEARNAMWQRFQANDPGLVSTLSNIGSPDSDHERACLAITEMLAVVLTLPSAQQGPLVRYMFKP